MTSNARLKMANILTNSHLLRRMFRNSFPADGGLRPSSSFPVNNSQSGCIDAIGVDAKQRI